MDEVEFKDQEELKRYITNSFLDKFLAETGLKIEDVILVEHKAENGDTMYYFAKKTERVWRDKSE